MNNRSGFTRILIIYENVDAMRHRNVMRGLKNLGTTCLILFLLLIQIHVMLHGLSFDGQLTTVGHPPAPFLDRSCVRNLTEYLGLANAVLNSNEFGPAVA